MERTIQLYQFFFQQTELSKLTNSKCFPLN
uniref:Uncharacterized protein n=1 Tax=Arundo donax TaxID=35708 RepID=A0A0A9AF21_ARUDO